MTKETGGSAIHILHFGANCIEQIYNVKDRLAQKEILLRPSGTSIIAIREDPDEMPQYVAFHQGLHCLLRQNRSLEKKIQYF